MHAFRHLCVCMYCTIARLPIKLSGGAKRALMREAVKRPMVILEKLQRSELRWEKLL